MGSIFSKVKNYINQRYLVKYIDNKYWELADNVGNRVETLLHEEHFETLKKFYPALDLEHIRQTDPPEYRFLVHKLSRYIYKINDPLIDPDCNWVIFNNKQVFRYSYPLIEDPWDGVKPRPSRLGYLLRKKPLELEKGILVKYLWGNYYHFFADTLPQLSLADDFGIPKDVPVIVPYGYDKLPFISEFLKLQPIDRKIIVQKKGQYLKVKELYVTKDVFCSEYLYGISAAARKKSLDDRDPTLQRPELLFVTRKKGYRSVKNIEVIEAIARENGFTVIEPGNYTWREQLAFFSQVRILVGVHGAAQTSLIFSNNPKMKFLELYPGGGWNPEHYKNLSTMFGFQHYFMMGEGLNELRQFTIDPEAFKNALEVVMNEQ